MAWSYRSGRDASGGEAKSAAIDVWWSRDEEGGGWPCGFGMFRPSSCLPHQTFSTFLSREGVFLAVANEPATAKRPASALFESAGNGNRTHVTSSEGWRQGFRGRLRRPLGAAIRASLRILGILPPSPGDCGAG